jgi:type IV secretory pathway VirB10-like protein
VPNLRIMWPWAIASLAMLAMTAARGQDLDAGKTAAQLFAQDCSACHRSPQGLVKTMSGGSLVSFLRQHYTSSSASANLIAGYLLTAGGNPRDRQKDQAKQPPQPSDRAKFARPADPAPPRPQAAVPQANVPPSQPPASPSSKQNERLARPANPATDQGGGDQPGRSSRKSRRSSQATPAAELPAPSAAPSPSAAAASAPGAEATGTTGGASETRRPPATAVRPGFSEPLP